MAVRPATDAPPPLLTVGCFLKRANGALRRRVRTGTAVAVVFAGVAETGDIRGSRSGHAPDEVVRVVAEWVLTAPGPADSAVLVGGGEFAILCRVVRESAETDTIVRRIRAAMARSFAVGGAPVSVVTATAVAMASSPEDTAEDLIAAASRAMRAAGQWGGAGSAVPVQARTAPVAFRLPGTLLDRGDGSGRAASAGQAPLASGRGISAGVELAEAVIHRLFGVGVTLEAVAGQADGAVAAQIRQTVDELDAIIADARTAAFGVRCPPEPAVTPGEVTG